MQVYKQLLVHQYNRLLEYNVVNYVYLSNDTEVW
jgi:hypothetical protein